MTTDKYREGAVNSTIRESENLIEQMKNLRGMRYVKKNMAIIPGLIFIKFGDFYFIKVTMKYRETVNKKNYITIFIITAIYGILLTFPLNAEERTVTDQLNRKVNVPANPDRVVSLAPSITEIIFAIGEGHRLKGVTQFSDYPEKARTLPRVGSYVHLDIEKIVSLKPNLCIAVKDGNPKSAIDRLEQLKIPVYAVDPRNLESVMASISEIGNLFGAGQKTESIIIEMRSRIHKISQRVKKADDTPKVFFQIGITPIVSVGTQTFLHELIEMAGGENITKGPVPYPRYSKEQVIMLAPDIFIITSMARDQIFQKVKAEWSKWGNIPAVKNNRMLLVDSDVLDRASPRLVDGYELLAKLIHPELFKPGWEKE